MSSLKRIARHAVTGSPTGTWSGGSIPSPQAGLVLPVNQSPAVWAECWLFQGSFSERSLITSHPTIRGKLIFVKTPLKHFKIDPPMSQPYKNSVASSAITVPIFTSNIPCTIYFIGFSSECQRMGSEDADDSVQDNWLSV